METAFGADPIRYEIGMPAPWALHVRIIAQDESTGKQDMLQTSLWRGFLHPPVTLAVAAERVWTPNFSKMDFK